MRWSLASLLATLPLLAGIAAATGEAPGADFERRLAAAQANPEQADFTALRLAYARSPAYRPGLLPVELETGPIDQEVANGERVAALLALDRWMAGRWMDIPAHLHAGRACARLGEDDRAQRHLRFASGLLRSILNDGDGHGLETAWKVIDAREESGVLDVLGLGSPRKRALVEVDGHSYDVLTVPAPGRGGELTLYFNIDVPRQWLARSAADPPAKRPERSP